MSNNIVKANFIQFTGENTRVIDSNALVAKKIDGSTSLLREKEDISDDAPQDTGTDSFDGMDPLAMAELLGEGGQEKQEETPPPDVDAMRMECEDLLAKTRRDAEEIKNLARKEIDQTRRELFDQARKEGYEDGWNQAMKELDIKKEELEQERLHNKEEYEELVRSIEPEMVDIITGVYEDVFGDNFYNRRDVLIQLINKALINIGNNNQVVYVSAQDYDKVLAAKDSLMGTGNDVDELDIRRSNDLEAGQAKIETGYGIIDCGVETELRELSKTLHVLAYRGQKADD